MNHRKLQNEKEFDDEADYLMIINKKKLDFMRKQLVEELHL